MKCNCKDVEKLIVLEPPITNPPREFSRLWFSESLWKMLQDEPCLHSGHWGFKEILGKIIRFYWKIAENWKNCKIKNLILIISIICYNAFSHNTYHKYSWLMTQTQFVHFGGSFWGKNHGFLTKICETVTSKQ
jgi:hypothetical protein